MPLFATSFVPATQSSLPVIRSGKSFELTAHYCSFCREQVLHTVLEKMGSSEHVRAGLASVLLQCTPARLFPSADPAPVCDWLKGFKQTKAHFRGLYWKSNTAGRWTKSGKQSGR